MDSQTNQQATLPRIDVPSFLEKAYKDERPIVVIKAGRRTGKTLNFALWLLQQLDNKPGSSGLWVDTVAANIDRYMQRYFKPLLKKMNHWEDCDWNERKKILKLYNGSYIDFGSAERPENLEGFEYDFAVLNEAGIILKKKGLWDNTLLPMFKKARVRIIGTPKGKNKFETLYNQYPRYSFSCYDSPFWTEAEVAQAKVAMTQEAFNQEMLAAFIEGAGAVFRNITENIGGSLIDKPVEGGRYVLAADLAKHTDFTVILVGDLETNRVVYHERFNQIDWGLQKTRITEAYKRFHCVKGIIDATGVGDSVFDDLTNAGLNLEGFKFTSTTKQELISNLSIAMDNQTIGYPAIETLIDELSMYAYEQKANGNFSYSAPEGLHDDEVIALALLNRAMNFRIIEYGTVEDIV